MLEIIKTIEEARAYRYDKWIGSRKGIPYKEGRCAYEVWSRWLPRQCSKKNGKGVNGLYCGTHANKLFRLDTV